MLLISSCQFYIDTVTMKLHMLPKGAKMFTLK